jgi:hypothetical protein
MILEESCLITSLLWLYSAVVMVEHEFKLLQYWFNPDMEPSSSARLGDASRVSRANISCESEIQRAISDEPVGRLVINCGFQIVDFMVK